MQASYLQGRTLRVFAWVSTVVLALATIFATMGYRPLTVQAAEVTSRSIDMVSSQENAQTNYVIQFTIPAGSTVGAVRVEFCDNDPLPHQTCTFTAVGDDIPQVDGNAGAAATEGTPAASFTGASGNCATANVALTAPTNGDRYLEFTCSGGTEVFGAATTFNATVNNVDNPDNSTDSPTNPNNTFYARIYIYNTNAPAAIANPVSTTNVIHYGGIAMSTAEQLTITARVQEILEFCVGDAETVAAGTDDCSDISGNDIDMGVLSFAAINLAGGASCNTVTGEDSCGYAMVRTNAAYGAVVDYFANNGNANDSEVDGFNDGHLAVAGQNCAFPATSVDQCINSGGTTASTLTAGVEEFGMAVRSVDTTGSSTPTANLIRDAQYDFTGSNEYAFDGSGATDRIASATTVVDDEMLVLDWAGTSAITTPTGLYSTVLTFIATSTF